MIIKGKVDVLFDDFTNCQTIYKLLDAFCCDQCSDVIHPVLSSLPCFVQRCEVIHMIAEQIIRSLTPLLKHKSHSIRHDSIFTIKLLFQLEIDRNNVIFENHYSSFLPLLKDSYSDVQKVNNKTNTDVQEVLEILKFCLQKNYCKELNVLILEVISSIDFTDVENAQLRQIILTTPIIS